MDVSVEPRWEAFIADLLSQGRYASATEVVAEGLKLIEEREANLKALRETLEAAIAEGGAWTDDEAGASLDRPYADLKAQGF